MGYRSDVIAVFYSNNAQDFPSVKLFIDENMPETFRGDDMSTVDCRFCKGIKFEMTDVKWYPSYPDVGAFDNTLRKFIELADSEGSSWMCEFIRLGEEDADVERINSATHDFLLSVNRSIECAV